MKSTAETQPATPFEKMKELTQRLLAVPKKEIDQKIAEYEKKKNRKKRKNSK